MADEGGKSSGEESDRHSTAVGPDDETHPLTSGAAAGEKAGAKRRRWRMHKRPASTLLNCIFICIFVGVSAIPLSFIICGSMYISGEYSLPPSTWVPTNATITSKECVSGPHATSKGTMGLILTNGVNATCCDNKMCVLGPTYYCNKFMNEHHINEKIAVWTNPDDPTSAVCYLKAVVRDSWVAYIGFGASFEVALASVLLAARMGVPYHRCLRCLTHR
eukprot:TRINITY_DN4746_c0_g1_i1.p1 TRINITY_DN4746_c0_g1~~TRINITY_DN4746_c0_g1_i1.p1  ORF type:complete len:219 (+),score=54.19 TRINITY_DN4746_c0_g1_i1:56-712(+)